MKTIKKQLKRKHKNYNKPIQKNEKTINNQQNHTTHKKQLETFETQTAKTH